MGKGVSAPVPGTTVTDGVTALLSDYYSSTLARETDELLLLSNPPL